MDVKKDSQELLLKYTEYFKSINGLQIIFIVNFTSMTLTHKLIESSGVENTLLSIVKESAILFKKNALDIAYLDGKERIFIKRVKENNSIVVLVSDNRAALGSVFRLLDQIS